VKDIYISKNIHADCIEIHTGRLSDLVKLKKNYKKELSKIKRCSILAQKLGIEVHAGHGLDYKTTKLLNKINEIKEFNIGHYLIGESIFFGLTKVIKKFKKIINI
jgi:pyridoxine 5-phosphate synthase